MRLKADKTASFDDFTSLIKKLLKADWGSDCVTFTHAFPNGTDPSNVKMPIITYHCKKKVPGLVGADTREIKPRFREVIYEEDGEVDAYEVRAQVFDLTVVFDVWHETNAGVDELADRFENFMMTYSGYMMKSGIQRILFLEQTDTTEAHQIPLDVVVRSFQYLVRIEKQVAVPVSTIKEVTGLVDLLIGDETDSSIDESLDFKIVKGGN